MFENLLSTFLQSQQGQAAVSLLQQQGLSPQQANDAIQSAVPAVTGALQSQGATTPQTAFSALGGHAGSSMLLAAIAGLVRGEGLGGALQDGVTGVVIGRIAEAVASRVGLPADKAAQIAAVLGPMLLSHLHGHLAQTPSVQEQHGAPPAPAPGLPGLPNLGSILGGLFNR